MSNLIKLSAYKMFSLRKVPFLGYLVTYILSLGKILIYFQVGNAINKKIAEGVVKREDLFVTTKVFSH